MPATKRKPPEDDRSSTTQGHRERPIMALLDLLGQRWTLRILWELREERLTFRALQSRCDRVSPTVMNRRLKALRDAALIDHDEGGYGLTEQGQRLREHLLALSEFAHRWSRAGQ